MGRRSWIPEQKDEYLGNIWGWKISFIGLGLIIVLSLLMLYRSCQIAENPNPQPIEQNDESQW